MQVATFAALARSGAYLAGSRQVSPRERTRWRFTFRRLVADARTALGTEPITTGAEAMSTLISLACETGGLDYFRSDDPIAAAGVVVSDQVELLWSRIRQASGFPTFAQTAAEQLVRWESAYGWTRRGMGTVAAKERALADVAAGLLPVTDAWVTFAGHYLDVLDRTRDARPSGHRPHARAPGGVHRAESLARWHQLLVERLVDTEGEPLLDRLATHGALAGPDLALVQARLALHRGDPHSARRLARDALRALPGHPELLALSRAAGESVPPRERDLTAG